MPNKSIVGDYVSLQRGTTYKGSLVGKPGPALLGLGSIRPGGGFRDGDYKTYGGECPQKLMLFPGDLFVSLKGATKDGKMIGSIARVPLSVSSGRLTQDTVKLIFRDSDVQTASFLYWLLRTPQYRKYCAARATGSAVVALSRDDFLNYSVPPITQARIRIVDLLEALDRKIELNRQANATLEFVARALFKSWFVDFDPVRAKAAGRDPGLRKPIADLFPVSFEDTTMGEVPKGWSVDDMQTNCEAVKGLSYKGDGLADSGTPLHNLNSIYEGGGYKYEGIKYYNGDHRERHRIRPGDIIVANTEQGHDRLLIGYAAILPRSLGTEGIFSHHIYRLRPRHASPLTAHYICHLLNSPRTHDLVSRYANGTTVNMLPIEAVQKPSVVIPPEQLVKAFDTFATNVANRCDMFMTENTLLSAVREAILPQLISGAMSPKTLVAVENAC
jgi:restriction endonuclease S subunit